MRTKSGKRPAWQTGDVMGHDKCAVCGRVVAARLFDGYTGPFVRVKESDFVRGSKLVRSPDPKRGYEWRCPDHLPENARGD
jgi:hypothetical protein